MEVEQLINGKLTIPGSIFTMSRTPGDATQPALFTGQHNAQAYSELLEYAMETIDTLQSEGVI